MDYHIPERPDRSLLKGRQTTRWSLWDVVFHENDSTYYTFLKLNVSSDYRLQS